MLTHTIPLVLEKRMMQLQLQAADPHGGGGGGDPQCLLSVIVHVVLLNFWSKVMLLCCDM